MKYLKEFKLFENNINLVEKWDNLDYTGKLGNLLYLYGSIPVSRNNSEIVLPILLKKYNKIYNIIEDKKLEIDFNNSKIWDLSNSLRFSNYFSTLIENKSTMGFNFEGTIAGFFNGKLSDSDNTRYDVIINNKCFSIKTSVVEYGDNIVIGSFKNVILENYDYFKEKYNIDIIDEIIKTNGIGYFFTDFHNDDLSSEDIKNIKYDLLHFMFSTNSKEIVSNKVDYIVITFVDIKKESPSYINMYIISINDFIDFLINKGGMSPKIKTNIYQLRVPKTIIYKNVNQITFKFRNLTEEELDDLRNTDSLKWATDVFDSTILSRMRPDVINDIYSNRHKIIKRLLKKYVSF